MAPDVRRDGMDPQGAARGLLFPTSFARWQGSLSVTNLALPLTPAVGGELQEGVTTYTVARIPIR